MFIQSYLISHFHTNGLVRPSAAAESLAADVPLPGPRPIHSLYLQSRERAGLNKIRRDV